MPGGRGLFSPIGTSAISRLPGTPQDYVSPSMRRHVSVTSPAVAGGVATLLVTPTVNDDEAERKERRRSKVSECYEIVPPTAQNVC